MPDSPDPSRNMRRLLLALAAFGLVGITTELVFLEHYEDSPMFIPLVMNVVALAAIMFHALGESAATVRVLRVVMVLLVATSLTGIVLHYRGSLAFQVDMDPTLSASQLFWKVLHMKAPPTMAPGALAQLGLLGLVATYRHPALRRGDR